MAAGAGWYGQEPLASNALLLIVERRYPEPKGQIRVYRAPALSWRAGRCGLRNKISTSDVLTGQQPFMDIPGRAAGTGCAATCRMR
jgi:hypothetical protein